MSRVDARSAAFSFSGLSADTAEVNAPRAMIEKLVLDVEYTVTDASISAGENFDGCIDEVILGEGRDIKFEAGRNELALWADYLTAGTSTGVYSDPQPTTATAQRAHFVLHGPFDLRGLERPTLRMALRAITDEFGGASAFTATVNVAFHIDDDGEFPAGMVARRAVASSQTEPRVTVPAEIHLRALGVVTGSGGVLTKYSVTPDVVDVPASHSGHALYSQYKQTAPNASPTRYLTAPIESPPSSGRTVEASLSSAATTTVLFLGLDE